MTKGGTIEFWLTPWAEWIREKKMRTDDPAQQRKKPLPRDVLDVDRDDDSDNDLDDTYLEQSHPF